MKANYLIPVENLHSMREKISKLNKKAAKIGVHPIVVMVGEREMVLSSYSGEEEDYWAYPVSVEGETPKFEGWSFIATLGYFHGGEVEGMISRMVPGERLPKEFLSKTAPWCDHCGTSRLRKDTYAVFDGKEYKEVGSSCIKDFLGHGDPHKIAAFMSYVFSVSDEFDEMERYSGGRMNVTHCDISEYLPYAVEAVKARGWVSAAKSEEWGKTRTSHTAWGHYENHIEGCRCGHDKITGLPLHSDVADLDPTAESRVIANSVYDMILDFSDKEEMSNWEYNLNLIFRNRLMERRNAGLVTSGALLHFIPLWNAERVEKDTAASDASPSEHLGAVGDRMTVGGVTLLSSFASYGDFGTSYILKFVDTSGNKLVWFSSKDYDLGEYTMVGTVKKHGEYKGIKETAVNRCKLVEVS